MNLLNHFRILIFSLILMGCSYKTISQNIDFGLSYNRPFHINLMPTDGLKFIPQFEQSFGSFLIVNPSKSVFGARIEILSVNQTSTYEVVSKDVIKEFLQISSHYYEFSLNSFNVTKKKLMFEYGFSIKSKHRIDMVNYARSIKLRMLNEKSIGNGLVEEIDKAQKISQNFIPSLQFGISYPYKFLSFGSKISVDLNSVFKSSYQTLYEGIEIKPQFFYISIFSRISITNMLSKFSK